VTCLGIRGFRDRDFLSTREGFIFCVVGSYHPSDRAIGYLKYIPAPEGRWRKGKTRFRRVMPTYTIASLLETFNILRSSYPQYLFLSPVYNITMTAVPRKDMVKHYKPEEKLAELFKKPRLDSLQKKAVRLVSSLSKLSNAPPNNFGITGSVLLDIHNPFFSDIDITIYGAEKSHTVKNTVKRAFREGSSGVDRFGREKLKQWCLNKTQNHRISLADAKKIYGRRWNIGVFDETSFSMHPVKLEEELKEKYGDKTYYPAGTVTVRAVVVDSLDSIFLPAVYGVEEVEIESINVNIKEVVSYEGLYDSLADKGETIEAKGKLEHVLDNRTGEKYDRVLVGSPEGKGKEYIKPI